MSKPEWPKELTGTITVWPYSSTSLIIQDQLATTLATIWKRKAHEAGTKAKANHEAKPTVGLVKDDLENLASEAELGVLVEVFATWEDIQDAILEHLAPVQNWLIGAADRVREALVDFSSTLDVIDAMMDQDTDA